ncbi:MULTISPECIES: 2-dehydropantoate 2-reductase [Streptacidiphilus]|uniref:2-dehydropantoate 2-reductase n=1 Tax=Streptacidiphilus cavernicola TaxID=3342716 RepID=A0ABV6UTJ1_9ACTN|nr:2-dehydropantoate 2-reductase [Streptacidiphilus jeojiense]
MRICVVGAGAVGGFIGARLALAGVETSAVARGATLDSLRRHGWRLESAERPDDAVASAPVRATDDAAELGVQDVVVLAVKAHAVRSTLDSLAHLVGPETAVVAALNGVPWWFFDGFGGPCEGRHLDTVDPGGRIAAAVPTTRVVGCVVHVSCSTPEPGLVHHHKGEGLILGEPDNTDSPRVGELVSLLRGAGLEATGSTAIQRDVWFKLWGNMTMNPVSALTGATGDLILDDELVMAFCHAAMREAAEIGARIGCPIEQSPEDRSQVTRKLGVARTSMLQDAQAGRRLELDALVGSVREIGGLLGLATPSIDAMLGLTRLSARVHGLL